MTKKHFLDGETIYLRPLSLDDLAADYPAWLNDPEVSAHNSHHTFPYTLGQAKGYVESIQNDPQNLVLAIVAKDTDKHIGNIALQRIHLVDRNAEYAIMLGDKNYWGKGVGREASKLLLAHGFSVLNLHRIYCGTSSNNVAMQKLAIALGMREEGRRREAQFKNGEYVDIIEYGILENEFAA
ncbi:MAG: GNAT family protein [Minisyncoccia bacterium]